MNLEFTFSKKKKEIETLTILEFQAKVYKLLLN